MPKRIFVIGAVLILAIGAGFFYFRQQKGIEVELGRVERQTITSTLATTGHLKADRYAELTFPSLGIVQTLSVRVGDQVAAGQTLAVQNQTVLYQKLAKANSVLEDARFDWSQAPTEEERTYQELVNQAWHDLQVAQKNLADSVLSAPFAGIVAVINHQVGELTSLTTPTITLADFETLYFETEVPEDDLGKITLNQEVVITFDSYPEAELLGTVRQIHPQVTLNVNQERIVNVEVVLTMSPEIPFTLDLAGNADFVLEEKGNVLVIPSTALFFEDGQALVYQIDGEGKAKPISVETGLENNEWVEIVSGVEEGAEIVVSAEEELKPGLHLLVK